MTANAPPKPAKSLPYFLNLSSESARFESTPATVEIVSRALPYLSILLSAASSYGSPLRLARELVDDRVVV